MEIVPPSQQALREALGLSEETLRNIELGELPLTQIALKTSRLARLLNDSEMHKIMQFEVSGYPYTASGVSPEVFRLATIAGRQSEVKDSEHGTSKQVIYYESIGSLEQSIGVVNSALQAAQDPSISVSSANPNQVVSIPIGHQYERNEIRYKAAVAASQLSGRQAFIYQYVLAKHYELKYSGIADDVFSRIRQRVDSSIGKTVPDAVQKLSSVYDNLRSTNTEDWSNACHSCRRILQDLADAVCPPQQDRVVIINGKEQTIKMGEANYINRILAFVEDHSKSEKFQSIVGSQLRFLGDRLDSVFEAAQKGSHTVIMNQAEADRYVVYTYLILGDVLSLIPS
jgi:hypothetical protein